MFIFLAEIIEKIKIFLIFSIMFVLCLFFFLVKGIFIAVLLIPAIMAFLVLFIIDMLFSPISVVVLKNKKDN